MWFLLHRRRTRSDHENKTHNIVRRVRAGRPAWSGRKGSRERGTQGRGRLGPPIGERQSDQGRLAVLPAGRRGGPCGRRRELADQKSLGGHTADSSSRRRAMSIRVSSTMRISSAFSSLRFSMRRSLLLSSCFRPRLYTFSFDSEHADFRQAKSIAFVARISTPKNYKHRLGFKRLHKQQPTARYAMPISHPCKNVSYRCCDQH